MAIWLTRAGGDGDYRLEFIQENRVYVICEGLDVKTKGSIDAWSLIY